MVAAHFGVRFGRNWAILVSISVEIGLFWRLFQPESARIGLNWRESENEKNEKKEKKRRSTDSQSVASHIARCIGAHWVRVQQPWSHTCTF